MLELLKRNIDIRSSERQRRYGSLNLICLKYKRESEGARTFQVSAIRFWNSLLNEIGHFRVAACFSFKASPGAQPFKWK